MLRRISFRTADKKTENSVALIDEDLHFEVLKDVPPWVSRGDIIAARPVAREGIHPGELAVVRVARGYGLDVCPPNVNQWNAWDRVVGAVFFSARTPNISALVEQRLACLKTMAAAGGGGVP